MESTPSRHGGKKQVQVQSSATLPRVGSLDSTESAVQSVTRQVRVVQSSQSIQEDEDAPGGLSLLLNLYRFNERITMRAKSLASMLTGTGSSKAWSPGVLERSLYDGKKRDDDSSDILNIKELFRGSSDAFPDSDPNILQFHLSPWARIVELIRLISVVGTCITAPLSFILAGEWALPDSVPGGHALLAMDCSFDVVYAVCLVIRFRISFLHPLTKKEVTDPLKIRRYFTGSFVWWLEAISVFSHLWLGLGASLLLNNLKIIRVGPLLKSPDALWRWEDSKLVRLGRPPFLLVLAAHWTACLLFTLGGFRDELMRDETEYATKFNMGYGISGEVSGGVSLYFMAFVEALYMLTGAMDNPLGDGGPRNKDFGALLMIAIFGPVGCVVVALFISAIMREQQRALALDSKHEESKAFMERALQILEIPDQLQQRVLSMHLFQKFEHDVEAFNSLFEKKNLSKPLENTLLVYLYRDGVAQSPYFRGKDPNYIIAVLQVLEDEVYLPGDYVARRGEVAHAMYFVSRGVLSIHVPDHEDEQNVDKAKEIKKLSIGEQFGEIALVKDTVRTAWVRADTYAIVSALPSKSIRHVWDFYPREKEELVRTVEAHAKRDRERKAKQRWERGLAGATVTPWKIRGMPSTHSLPKPKGEDGVKSSKSVTFEGQAQSEQSEQSDGADTPKSTASREPSPAAADVGEFVGRRLQAVEGRMDELLRRQSSLERVLTEELARLQKTLLSGTGSPPSHAEEKERGSWKLPLEEKWTQRSAKGDQEPRKRSKQKVRRVLADRPCLDLITAEEAVVAQERVSPVPHQPDHETAGGSRLSPVPAQAAGMPEAALEPLQGSRSSAASADRRPSQDAASPSWLPSAPLVDPELVTLQVESGTTLSVEDIKLPKHA
ncbi:HCN2 [Symbiodinium natans]|uniref:HCN2 protein n=1 Tax=Symbiodinium natans TaxID=878477 RepID=A0A812HUT1_9DINO|nr:HCN2 [Symbiodinium natans]